MAIYVYKAIDMDGKIHKGQLNALSDIDVDHRLEGIDLHLLTCRIKKNRHGFGQKNVTRQELITFVTQLEQLTRAGLSIIESLRDLRDSQPAGLMKDALTNIADSIEGGSNFSGALEDHQDIFSHIFISLIKVGETSGELYVVLHNLAENLKWSDEIISQTKKMMIYPSIVGVVLLAVTVFLMIYLVPQLVPFIISMGGELPFHTLALIALSDAMVDYWYLIFGVPFVITIIIKNLITYNDTFHYKMDSFILKIPIFGNLLLKIKLARFTNYFGLLYKNGVSVLETLAIVEKLVDNLVIEEAVSKARQQISEGVGISAAFGKMNLFPPLVIKMLHVGEIGGGLDQSLEYVSYFYDREVKEAVDKLEPAIEPVLTVTMGLIMLWIMSAMLGPVYDTLSNINY